MCALLCFLCRLHCGHQVANNSQQHPQVLSLRTQFMTLSSAVRVITPTVGAILILLGCGMHSRPPGMAFGFIQYLYAAEHSVMPTILPEYNVKYKHKCCRWVCTSIRLVGVQSWQGKSVQG